MHVDGFSLLESPEGLAATPGQKREEEHAGSLQGTAARTAGSAPSFLRVSLQYRSFHPLSSAASTVGQQAKTESCSQCMDNH